jgi:hypothetical protein
MIKNSKEGRPYSVQYWASADQQYAEVIGKTLSLRKNENKRVGGAFILREYSQLFFSRINPNKRLGFLNTWFSSPILLGFLLLPIPIHSPFQENQVFEFPAFFCLVFVWF